MTADLSEGMERRLQVWDFVTESWKTQKPFTNAAEYAVARMLANMRPDFYRIIRVKKVFVKKKGVSELKHISSADVVERKTGKWVEDNDRPKSMIFRCSECNGIAYYPQNFRKVKREKKCRYPFCPNCGAEMEEPT